MPYNEEELSVLGKQLDILCTNDKESISLFTDLVLDKHISKSTASILTKIVFKNTPLEITTPEVKETSEIEIFIREHVNKYYTVKNNDYLTAVAISKHSEISVSYGVSFYTIAASIIAEMYNDPKFANEEFRELMGNYNKNSRKINKLIKFAQELISPTDINTTHILDPLILNYVGDFSNIDTLNKLYKPEEHRIYGNTRTTGLKGVYPNRACLKLLEQTYISDELREDWHATGVINTNDESCKYFKKNITLNEFSLALIVSHLSFLNT